MLKEIDRLDQLDRDGVQERPGYLTPSGGARALIVLREPLWGLFPFQLYV
ncbi:Hypothetical protein DEACI_2147 [Acididesulfobacillus acetoxydans]|uniref:Uncharacterized protein n=1 Tax=Acididesulfobacillus acetoxydans TaxID=1561005 RepID=A0A8S0X5B4_9FIRM|nr:Hypothetical protein DEACI_2147 [Acididesulfobacillus acetoxydans]CEJ06135.1 Hypothetical protein DEACI_0581 [Acididesulfobacillus acetoxydans]